MVSLKNAIHAWAAHNVFRSVANSRVDPSCTKAIPSDITIGQPQNISITSSDVHRSYLIVVPPLYASQSSTPVIFSFHGGHRNSSQQLALDQMTNPEFNNFAITIYPQGVKGKWEGNPGNTANDTQLVSDIIDSLDGKYCIDRKRIWATGKSDGGGFCNTLACDPILSTKIATFASVSGAYYIDTQPCFPNNVTIPCSPGRPKIPMIEFHGGEDSTIHYDGQANRSNQCIPTVPHWVHQWALRDKLDLKNATTNLTHDTVVYIYGKGEDEGLVQHVFDRDLDHDWPSTVLNADLIGHGEGPASFNATPIIMDFFQKHNLP
ncbi:hypothetical protein BOTNAR_0289g00060 [Botryotinia narcissicola]|uniref:feruloyl esterase n=1 Tax=Botryotinia narcissicola TaxID=278944 RepID=A0A4Z1HX73_9HELO|nr:hypothetical protein BOTNAR_0289g00060 [Botryotinia narcissicola]